MNAWKRFADAAVEEIEAARSADDSSRDRLRDALKKLECAVQVLESETQTARAASK